jgi:hypothetical protein
MENENSLINACDARYRCRRANAIGRRTSEPDMSALGQKRSFSHYPLWGKRGRAQLGVSITTERKRYDA